MAGSEGRLAFLTVGTGATESLKFWDGVSSFDLYSGVAAVELRSSLLIPPSSRATGSTGLLYHVKETASSGYSIAYMELPQYTGSTESTSASNVVMQSTVPGQFAWSSAGAKHHRIGITGVDMTYDRSKWIQHFYICAAHFGAERAIAKNCVRN